MGGIIRFTDLCSGHDCWPPRIGVTFSPNVFVNNLPVGVNITGAVKDDINVLNIAYALESNMDYKNMIAKEVE